MLLVTRVTSILLVCTVITHTYSQTLQNQLEASNASEIEYGLTSTKFEDQELDIVEIFLSQLETIDAESCTPGTESSLGEGVVQQYGKSRFRDEAELAVNRANLLTEIWKLPNEELHNDEAFFFSQVKNLVMSDSDIFAAGNCYDEYEYKDYRLFCPFAYRNTENSSIMVKDLSVEYPYLGSTYEWFVGVKAKAEALIPSRNITTSYQKLRDHFVNGTPYHSHVTNDTTILVTYDDGKWSTPYYDCGGGDIWMMTYTVPFFEFKNGRFKFKGTSGIDIDLQKVDIDQCDTTQMSTEYNVFANSSKCLLQTTECQTVRGLGFRRGSYKCVCKRGYYFPNVNIPAESRYFNGSDVEQHFHWFKKGEKNSYTEFQCLKCREGCDFCEDDSPCFMTPDWVLRNTLLSISCLLMFAVVPAITVGIVMFRNVKVIKAASPKLLYIVLIGIFLLYCPLIVMYFEATEFTCTVKLWFRELGFSISYGALLVKTWRISVVFRIDSATQVKITDTCLMKRLAIIVACFIAFLILRTAVGRPTVEQGMHRNGLKISECSFATWDYVQAVGEYSLLLWGIKLCIEVRRAPSEFNESKFISWAIYNESLLAIFFNLSMFLVRKIDYASGDLLYSIHFAYTNLTTTVTLGFLFCNKAYLIYKQRNNPTGTRTQHPSGFKYASKMGTSGQTVDNKNINTISAGKEETMAKLREAYIEIESLKHLIMLKENPHLSSQHHRANGIHAPVSNGPCVPSEPRIPSEPCIFGEPLVPNEECNPSEPLIIPADTVVEMNQLGDKMSSPTVRLLPCSRNSIDINMEYPTAIEDDVKLLGNGHRQDDAKLSLTLTKRKSLPYRQKINFNIDELSDATVV